MTQFNHSCPDLGSGLNMLSSSCAARVQKKQGKCAKCPSGIGYVKPAKKVKRSTGRPKKITHPVEKKTCDCGADLHHYKQKYCGPCAKVRKAAAQLRYNKKKYRKIMLARLHAKIERYETRLVELKERLDHELKSGGDETL